MTTNYILNALAVEIALLSVNVKKNELKNCHYEITDGLHSVKLVTDFHSYECLVDSESMEVLGICSEPATPLKY